MRLIAPHFARPALLQNAFRHTIVHSKITPAAARAQFSIPRRLYCAQAPAFNEDDMGKEDKSGKNFTLKVPKGTRDCTTPIRKHCHVLRLH
jgi:histidyl-tRNA synthetase